MLTVFLEAPCRLLKRKSLIILEAWTSMMELAC